MPPLNDNVMSIQKGLIKLTGKIGGVSFYTANGKFLARMSGGPTKERISSDPAFKRTRENNKEFGAAAKVSKALRTSLSAVIGSMAGSYVSSRLTALFKKINLKGVGVRGQRPIELSANKELLEGFDLDKNLSLSSVFSAPFMVTTNADRDEFTLNVPAFVPANLINAPSGATHFRLAFAVGVVSDYVFDTNLNEYEPTEADTNGVGLSSFSSVEDLNANTASFNLVITAPNPGVLPATVSAVASVGIEFYQRVGTDDYLLAQGNTMKIVEVF